MGEEKKSDVKDKSLPIQHATLQQKILTKLVWVVLAVIALGVGVILFWAFQSEKVLTVNNEPFPVRTIREHPTANGVVILKVDFCKHQDVEGNLRVSFLNTTHEVFLPMTKERGEKGCNVTELPVIIPASIQPGEYRIKFRVFYDVNPLKRQIPNEFTSQPFIITEEAAGPAVPGS